MSEEFYQSIDAITDDIATAMHDTAKELSTLTPGDKETEIILRDLFNDYLDPAGIAWVSADNTVVSVPIYSMASVLNSPELRNITEESFAGRDVILIDPVMSNAYGMVVCFVVPVYAADGSYNGYLCFAHLPITLLNETPDTPYYKNTKYELWISNSEGTIFCHPDISTIGYNYYTNAFYRGPGKAFTGIRPIIETGEGTTGYQYYDISNSDIVEKVCIWKTLSFGGQDLRLVLVDSPYEATEVSFPDAIDPTVVTDITQTLFLYAKKYGKGATLAAMNDPSGPFSNTDIEIFAISTDGIILAMPSKDKIVGLDRINFQDAYGIRQIATMINRASQGGGYLHYYLNLPYSENQTIFGLAYVLPVDETWFVGSRESVLDPPHSFNRVEVRSKLIRAIQPVQEYVAVHGKEETLAALTDPSSGLHTPDVRLVAISYDGKYLSSDFSYPYSIGDDLFSLTDPHGTSVIRDLVLIAKQGGGFGYVEARDANSDVNDFLISLAYVEPVDDEWLIAGTIALDMHSIVPS
ncbi:hypothetical protein McpCs1_11600 [Methanocorpusculaceae archaeon Cs1]|uniref:Single Cache domain-containing protein n=2 Tax=Methanorbis rubei TaxID=3028300 RepID=A0AAE4SC75_9EURY|nr:hypothetical protein [Methanocorpusculaceae archaeon Cs1]